MGGSSKGGSSSTKPPKWLSDAGKYATERAKYGAEVGPVFNPGLQFADFSPAQYAYFDNVRSGANAFGLNAGQGTGLPAPTVDPATGMRGYSAYPMTMGMIDQHAELYPAQAEAIQATYMDPVTGELPVMGGNVPMSMGEVAPGVPRGATATRAMGHRPGGIYSGDGRAGAELVSGPERGGRAAMGAPSRGQGGGLLGGIADAIESVTDTFDSAREGVGDFLDNPLGRG